MFKKSNLTDEQRLVAYKLIAYVEKAAGLISLILGADLLINGGELSGQCDFAEHLMVADQHKNPDNPIE